MMIKKEGWVKRVWNPAIFIVVLGAACSFSGAVGPNRVCFDGHCIFVEIAQADEELQRGLQDRKSLGEENGMLFIFPQPGIYGFWMKDTLIPLDIIWLNEERKVIYVAESVPPCPNEPCATYGPAQESRYVLEINSGGAKHRGIRTGDQAVFEFSR